MVSRRRVLGLCGGSAGTGAGASCEGVFKETVKLGGGVVVEMKQGHL